MTLRITAGAAALAMPLSFWLLAFSVFLFLSQAFVKRYAELQTQALVGKAKVHGGVDWRHFIQQAHEWLDVALSPVQQIEQGAHRFDAQISLSLRLFPSYCSPFAECERGYQGQADQQLWIADSRAPRFHDKLLGCVRRWA